MSPIDSVIRQLRDERSAHVQRLEEWLRIPSISTATAHDADTRRAGEFILSELRESGLEAEMIDTKRHPIVYGEWLGASGAPTVLIYGHYDVQPPDPVELWRHGPFEPTIEGENIVARGATDDKGQALALVRGVGGMLRVLGSLPVNVKLIIEGEEEIGSPNLEPFIRQQKDRLAADAVIIADCSQFAPGRPAITVGLKGICYLQVEVRGPNRDLHSGTFGGAVANPGNALCAMIERLKDDKNRVTIPGFYDDVRPLSEDERREMAALGFDEEGFRQDLEVDALSGEEGYNTLERKWARPTLDVNGLLCGWTGEGAKTVLPAHAMAKFSMRLVPDQRPEKIEAATRAHLESICPPGCTVEVKSFHNAHPFLARTDSPAMRAACRAVEKGFGRAPLFIREGGSIPVVTTFQQELGVDSILLGLGLPDDNTHSPNEKLNLGDYQRGIETIAHFLEELGTA